MSKGQEITDKFSIGLSMLCAIHCLLLPLLLSSTTEAHDHSEGNHTSCGDFDQYINAEWKAENPVPATESRWGSFNILAKSNDKKTETLVNDLLKKQFPKNTYQQQIGDLYRSLLDTAARNQRGLASIQNYFKLIDNAQSFKYKKTVIFSNKKLENFILVHQEHLTLSRRIIL